MLPTGLQKSFTGIMLLAILLGGCDTTRPPTPPPAPPTPEEQFENFLVVLRKKVESNDMRTYSAVADLGSDPTLPRTSWQTKLSHELIPAEGDTPLRAIVTIRTTSEVTVVLPTAEEQAREEDNEDESLEAIRELNPELAELAQSTGRRKVGRLGTSPINTLKEDDASRYELEHRDGLWVVTTPLDHAKEPFTAAAIEFALLRQ